MEVCWWGAMTLLPHLLNFTTLPWVRAEVAWGEVMTAAGAVKALAAELHQRVVALKSGLLVATGGPRVVADGNFPLLR